MNSVRERTMGPITVAQEAGSERVRYLQKVYGLLFTGIVVYFAASILPVLGAMTGIPAAQSVVSAASGMPWILSFILIIGSAWIAQMVSMKPGVNLLAFYGFALIFGFLTIQLIAYAMVVTGTPQAPNVVGGLTLVGQALGTTVLAMGGLTAYVFISKKDFSFLGGFLTVGLFMLIGIALVSWIAGFFIDTNWSVLNLGLSIAATFLFLGYVLYDTSRLLHHFTTDMVVPAALALLIDFIILFRNILFILMARR